MQGQHAGARCHRSGPCKMLPALFFFFFPRSLGRMVRAEQAEHGDGGGAANLGNEERRIGPRPSFQCPPCTHLITGPSQPTSPPTARASARIPALPTPTPRPAADTTSPPFSFLSFPRPLIHQNLPFVRSSRLTTPFLTSTTARSRSSRCSRVRAPSTSTPDTTPAAPRLGDRRHPPSPGRPPPPQPWRTKATATGPRPRRRTSRRRARPRWDTPMTREFCLSLAASSFLRPPGMFRFRAPAAAIGCCRRV